MSCQECESNLESPTCLGPSTGDLSAPSSVSVTHFSRTENPTPLQPLVIGQVKQGFGVYFSTLVSQQLTSLGPWVPYIPRPRYLASPKDTGKDTGGTGWNTVPLISIIIKSLNLRCCNKTCSNKDKIYSLTPAINSTDNCQLVIQLAQLAKCTLLNIVQCLVNSQ